MKFKIIFILFVSLVLLITLYLFFSPGGLTIKKVVDGDTVVLSNGEKVRLIGLDTPETKDPRVKVQFFGKKATEYLKKIAEGKEVYLKYDQQKRDKYKRLLAYIYLKKNDVCLNEEMIKEGYAFAYTRFPFSKMDEYRDFQKKALLAGKGLWGENYKDSILTIERKQDLIKNAYRDAGIEFGTPTRSNDQESIAPKDFSFVGNKNSKTLHHIDCNSAKKMKEKNKVYFKTIDEALQIGYKKCRRCFKE